MADPGDFRQPDHAATWAAFGALAEAGTPIDYVTLAWECERDNPTYVSKGLPADELATMAQHTPSSPAPAVATVAHASLLRHTDAARQQVQTILAEDRDALTLVSAAADAYRDVGDHAHRLTGTTTTVSRASAALTPPATPPGIPSPSAAPPPARPLEEPPRRDHQRSW
ncbi:MAG: DnaB-like helicase N-terminal domain-containing protein [Pseudonocardiaceae bacterium]